MPLPGGTGTRHTSWRRAARLRREHDRSARLHDASDDGCATRALRRRRRGHTSRRPQGATPREARCTGEGGRWTHDYALTEHDVRPLPAREENLAMPPRALRPPHALCTYNNLLVPPSRPPSHLPPTRCPRRPRRWLITPEIATSVASRMLSGSPELTVNGGRLGVAARRSWSAGAGARVAASRGH